MPLELAFHPDPGWSAETLETQLRDASATVESRILAAMGQSSRQRVERGQSTDLPCIDFGLARIVLFPGATLVGYPLAVQRTRPGSFLPQRSASESAGRAMSLPRTYSSTVSLTFGYGLTWARSTEGGRRRHSNGCLGKE